MLFRLAVLKLGTSLLTHEKKRTVFSSVASVSVSPESQHRTCSQNVFMKNRWAPKQKQQWRPPRRVLKQMEKNRLRHARNETFLQLNTLTKMANGGKKGCNYLSTWLRRHVWTVCMLQSKGQEVQVTGTIPENHNTWIVSLFFCFFSLCVSSHIWTLAHWCLGQ